MHREHLELYDVMDPVVRQAMYRVPRHEFVPPAQVAHAYADRALSIGHGQTISQPFIVAYMSEALALQPGDRVLEIGTGSGYQAAVLAEMGMQVYSIEIIPELAAEAMARLARLGYTVQVRVGDGYLGWPEEAPYAAIIVTAAAKQVPPPLIEQLRPGGRLVIPLGVPDEIQILWLYTLAADHLTARPLGEVRFVPFTRAGPGDGGGVLGGTHAAAPRLI